MTTSVKLSVFSGHSKSSFIISSFVIQLYKLVSLILLNGLNKFNSNSLGMYSYSFVVNKGGNLAESNRAIYVQPKLKHPPSENLDLFATSAPDLGFPESGNPRFHYHMINPH